MVTYICPICKKESSGEPDEIYSYNNKKYCERCANEHFGKCTSCNEQFRRIDLMHNDGDYYCTDCFDQNYCRCNNCNCIIPNEDSLTTPDDNQYCESCYSDNICTCETCGVELWNNDARYYGDNNDEGPFCEACYTAYKRMPTTTFNICTSERAYGIELEFCIVGALPTLREYGNVKGDGSVNPVDYEEGYGREYASNIYAGDAGFDMIDAVCTKLESHGAFVNRTCGYHLHLDMTGESAKARNNIVTWWQALEDIIFSTVPQHRRVNTFCEPIALLSQNELRHNRYSALNTSAFTKYSTFEVRLHQGTLSPSVIKSWILFMSSFMDTFSQIECTAERVNAVREMSDRGKLIFLFQQTKMPLSLRKTICKRINQYEPILDLSKVA